jgi:hypothetical protein
MLHSVVQKQLHGFAAIDWEEDIQQIQRCLRIITYCASIDPIARKLQNGLTKPYRAVLNYKPITSTLPVTIESPAYLFLTPSNPSKITAEHVRISLYLLRIICEPFNGMGNNLLSDNLQDNEDNSDKMSVDLEGSIGNTPPFISDLSTLRLSQLSGDNPAILQQNVPNNPKSGG